MAANRVGRRVNRGGNNHSLNRAGGGRDSVQNLPRRQARVTVQYNRQELQRRLDVEKWIDCELDQLYRGQEGEMPEEVNIDELLDLKTDGERTHRLQDILHSCPKSTATFISGLVLMLHGLQTQEDLHNDGIDLPQLHIYPTRSSSVNREVLH